MNSRAIKWFAFLLMMVVGANALAMPTMGAAAGPHERPVNCHGLPGKDSAPAPRSYQCCQAGHNVAFVRVSSLPQFAREAVQMPQLVAPQILVAMAGFWSPAAVSSGGGPGVTPLRI